LPSASKSFAGTNTPRRKLKVFFIKTETILKHT
jgi:hypothetical protein